LWKTKDSLKDKKVVEVMRSKKDLDLDAKSPTSIKRRLRHMYRYASYFSTKLGAFLPKDGWPLKLLVIAEKKSDSGQK